MGNVRVSVITTVLDNLHSDSVGQTMILLQNPIFSELQQESVSEENNEEKKSIQRVDVSL